MSDSSMINKRHTEQSLTETTLEESDETLHFPWLRHYQAGVPSHLDIPQQPLTWMLDTTAQRYPHRCAFIYFGRKLTYAQFSEQAKRFAVALRRLGVAKGDRVALALPNIPQFAIAFYGILYAGAIVVSTNPLYTEREMQHQMVDSGAKVIVMLDSFYPALRAIRPQTALEHVIVTSVSDFLPPLQRLLYPLTQRKNKSSEQQFLRQDLAADATVHAMLSLLRSAGNGKQSSLPAPAAGEDLAVLQYTGGTTGLSRGAMLTHRNLLANAMQTFNWMPQARRGQDITLCIAPFFHAYGLTVGMNQSILGAMTMILLPRFNASEALRAIRRYRPTLFPGVPTLYIGIMRQAAGHPEYLRSIKYCISGSAPLPVQVQEDFERITGGKLVEGYGLSEASPVTHCNPLSTEQRRVGSIGLPLPDVEAAILSPGSGEPVPVGEIGEIVVKGPNIMRGYWQRDEDSKAMFIDGWMRTGDIGKMDANGYFYIIERAKDMIIASGFNVYPREVEEILFNHPAIEEAAVVGVADSYRGETVEAFVVLKPGFEPSDETRQSIQAFCRQFLAAYKVPRIIKFLDRLPRSSIGKVLRRELRTQS